MSKKPWVVHVDEGVRYKAALIATLYKLKVGDVVERAIMCYANVLRISDKMEQEFPKEGTATLPRSGNATRPPSLSKFREHAEFFKSRKATNDGGVS